MKTRLTTTYPIDLGDLGDLEFDLSCDYNPGDPGQASGPPEKCYESEPAEYEIRSVYLDGKPVNGLLGELVIDFLLMSEDFAEHLSDLYSEEYEDDPDA